MKAPPIDLVLVIPIPFVVVVFNNKLLEGALQNTLT